MDYSNLQSKTIFDFCDDGEILDDFVLVERDRYFDC